MSLEKRSVVKFSERQNLIYVRDTFEDVPVFRPENAILVLSKSNSMFDVGSLCYRLTRSKAGSNIRLVCLDSLDTGRRAAVTRLIEYFKIKDSKTGDKAVLRSIRLFQDWIDLQDLPIDFSDTESVKHGYNEYTKHLIFRKNLPKEKSKDKKTLTNNSASALQKRARIWCHCITQISLSEIEFWAPRILFNDRQESIPSADPITLEDCNKTCSVRWTQSVGQPDGVPKL